MSPANLCKFHIGEMNRIPDLPANLKAMKLQMQNKLKMQTIDAFGYLENTRNREPF